VTISRVNKCRLPFPALVLNTITPPQPHHNRHVFTHTAADKTWEERRRARRWEKGRCTRYARYIFSLFIFLTLSLAPSLSWGIPQRGYSPCLVGILPPSVAANTLPCLLPPTFAFFVFCGLPALHRIRQHLPSPLPPANHEKHTAWGVFLVFGMLRTQKPQSHSCFSYSVASLPPPSNLPHPLGMPDTPTCLPSPPLPAKHGKCAHVTCFSCLALLHLSPPAENEKHAQCGAFFVFSTTCAVPLTPSAFPLVLDMVLHPPSCRTWKAHPDGCAFHVRRTLCFPSCVEHREHTHVCGCVLCVRRSLFLCPHVKHGQHTHVSVLFVFGAPFATPLASNNGEHTHVGVFSVFGAPCAPPFAPDTENTPMWVCSLVFSPCPHLPLPFSYCFVR